MVESSPRPAINTSILFLFLLRFALNDRDYSPQRQFRVLDCSASREVSDFPN